MQDRDSPPQAEADTNGAADGVRQNAAQAALWGAFAKTNTEFSPLPWITATALIRAATMATAAGEEGRAGLVFPVPIRFSIRSPYQLRVRMRLRACSRLSKTCSF